MTVDILAQLTRAPAFSSFRRSLLEETVRAWTEERFAAGSAVVREGEEGDRLFLIVQGRAQATVQGGESPVPLAFLGRGETFGELALLDPSSLRRATVTALTDLRVLALQAADFRRLLASDPQAEAQLRAQAEALEIVRFIKVASPFARLHADAVHELARRVRHIVVPAGAAILRQGETGRECYLLRSGRVAVARREDQGAEYPVAELAAGALFGEAALLSGVPRNATIRAVDACELLALNHEDLLATMWADSEVSLSMMELMSMRDRPRRASGVDLHPETSPEGEAVTILRDRGRGAYFQLSARGKFIWDRLDGRHDLRDLALEYLEVFKAFAPEQVARIVGDLTAAGFVEGAKPSVEVAALLPDARGWRSWLEKIRALMEWKISLDGIDPKLTRWYGRVRWIYTVPGQLALATVAAAGLGAFALGRPAAQGVFASWRGGFAVWLLLIPVHLLAVVVHEAAHAFTVKAFGREVPRAGIGWYWLSPIAFVDTSAMWLAPKWPRVAVSAAGAYSSVVLAGCSALAAWAAPNPAASAALWFLALTLYAAALLNVNPLLEYDGYYVWTDILESPNLRRRSLTWLAKGLFKPSGWKGHGAELVYGAATVSYVFATAALMAKFCRIALEGFLAGLVPAHAAAGVAWTAGGAFVAVSGAALLGDLRASTRAEITGRR